MVTLLVTLCDPNRALNIKLPQFLHSALPLIMGEHRDFKFGVQVDHSKSRPADDRLSLKGIWSRHVTHFKFLVPLKYLRNGLSYRNQSLYSGWACEVLAFGFTNSISSGCGHSHVTSLNFGK